MISNLPKDMIDRDRGGEFMSEGGFQQGRGPGKVVCRKVAADIN